MALAPALGPIGRVRTSLVTAMHRADGTTVHDRSRSINLIASSEPIQQREVNETPHARSLPIAQAAPTRHPRPAPEFLREHVPRNAGAAIPIHATSPARDQVSEVLLHALRDWELEVGS